jgi:heme/copper-type cytochrome/quinol oxidase subunit 3
VSTPSTAAGLLPALPPAPERGRRNVMLVGTLFTVAAGTALFGGLLAAYFSARDLAQAAGEAWVPQDVILPNVPLFVGYLTLLMSSVTAQWSVSAINSRDRRGMYVAIGLTLVLGLAFVNALSFSWSELGMVAGASRFATRVYALTVTHLLVVIAAHVALVVVGFRALGGQFSPDNREMVVSAAAFWHFSVAVGLLIWYCVWFLEGGP